MKQIYFLLLSLFICVALNAQEWNSSGDNTSTGRLTLGDFSNYDAAASRLSASVAKLHINGGPMVISDVRFPNLRIARVDENVRRLEWVDMAIASSNGSYSRISKQGDFVFRYGGNKSVLFSATGGGDIRFGTGVSSDHKETMRLSKDGNLGIGTSNPKAKLHVNNGDNSYGTILANATESNFSLYAKTLGTSVLDGESFRLGLKYSSEERNGYISFYRGRAGLGGFLGFSTSGIERIRIDKEGNVGIGLKEPAEKLDVNGSIRLRLKESKIYWDWKGRSIDQFSSDGRSQMVRFSNSMSVSSGNPDGGFDFVDHNKKSVMRINNYTVGINTNDTKGFELGVNGKVAAHEVKVALYDDWPDFVFDNNYKLPTLKEVEAHINEKGHLKDIPSASEIKAKQGFFLGDMNAKLLQKVEELTLYTIQQEKKIKSQEKKIVELKNVSRTINKELAGQVKELIKRIEYLENR